MQTVLILAALLCVGTLAQFTPKGQKAIVDVHNKLRSKIALGKYVAKGTLKPAASDMLKMKLDKSLSTSAQAYANTCPENYEVELGRNIYYYRTLAPLTDIDELGANSSVAWEKEFQDFGWETNLYNEALYWNGVGHATQMAWAKTNLIGCGVKDCGKDDEGLFKVVVVCQYKPISEFDEEIYTTGDTCSACPSGTKCSPKGGLCA